MQARNYSYGLIALLTVSGCSKPPEAVFVDVPALVARERPPVDVPVTLPAPHDVKIPPLVAEMPAIRGFTIYDRAEGKIANARRLIDEDREHAKKTLARRLSAIANNLIDDEKRKALLTLQEEQAKYLDQVYAQLFAIFSKYADQRGPKIAQLELLLIKRKSPLANRFRPPQYAERQATEIAGLRTAIADLDETYDGDAERLLTEAEYKLSSEQGALHASIETKRVNALTEAEKEARNAISKATGNLDLNLGQNRSVTVNNVNGRNVTVSGSGATQKPILPAKGATGVVDPQERRRQVEQQLDIWLKTRGYVLAKSRSAGIDATNEFDAWRKIHRLGP